jgi:hypothetical protein
MSPRPPGTARMARARAARAAIIIANAYAIHPESGGRRPKIRPRHARALQHTIQAGHSYCGPAPDAVAPEHGRVRPPGAPASGPRPASPAQGRPPGPHPRSTQAVGSGARGAPHRGLFPPGGAKFFSNSPGHLARYAGYGKKEPEGTGPRHARRANIPSFLFQDWRLFRGKRPTNTLQEDASGSHHDTCARVRPVFSAEFVK